MRLIIIMRKHHKSQLISYKYFSFQQYVFNLGKQLQNS